MTDISGVKGICPSGWHVPNSTEFSKLKATVEDNSYSLLKLKEGLGTNTSGFRLYIQDVIRAVF